MGDIPISAESRVQAAREHVPALPSSEPSPVEAVTSRFVTVLNESLVHLAEATNSFFTELPLWLLRLVPEADRPRLLSSTEGRISHVVMAYGGLYALQGQLAFLQQRPDIERVTFLTAHRSDCDALLWMMDEAQIPRDRVLFLTHEDYTSTAVSHPAFARSPEDYQQFLSAFSPWVQDPWHVVIRAGVSHIVVGGTSSSVRNLYYLTDMLCTSGVIACTVGPSVEGADVLASDGHLFINAFYRNTRNSDYRYAQVSDFEVAAAFGAASIAWAGDPAHHAVSMHLDYFVTPIGLRDPDGRPIVVVGDMRLARDLLLAQPGDTLSNAEAAWGQRDSEWEAAYHTRAPHYERMYRAAERIYGPTRADVMGMMIAQASGQRHMPPGSDAARYRSVLTNAVYEPWEFTALMADQLDATAARLEADGFAVVRIPYLDPNHPESPAFPNLSYNNVLVEVYRDHAGIDHRVVTMPTYDLPVLDRAAQAVYERLGFSVIPVRGFVATTALNGSLHCVVKVLERTNL